MRWKFRRQRESKNPLFIKPNWQQFIVERFGIFSWLIILVILIIVYLVFYSPLLQITKIEIYGTKSIPKNIIEEKFVNWQLDQYRLKIFRQNNIIMFSRKWFGERLSHDYSLASLSVIKKYPHTLRITIIEKKPELVWISNNTYYMLGENGDIASILNNQTDSSLPQIIDDSNTEAKVGQSICGIVVDQDKKPCSDKVIFIKTLISELKKFTEFDITSYHMISGMGTQINAITKKGYAIYFDTSKDLTTQIDKLRRALSESSTQQNPPKEYIDVRLGDRVYLK